MATKDRWELKRIVHSKFNGKCSYCGEDIDLYNFHIDHFIPKRRYKAIGREIIIHGSDDIENLMPSCATCNSSKTDMDIEDFRDRIMDRLDRINKTSEYRIAKKYGLVKETGLSNILFYFEKLNIHG